MSTAAAPTTSYEQGFQSLDEEVTIDALEVSGELPAWLAGSLLRTGPARFELGGRSMRHWFDGLAMLHRFTIDGGGVSYGNRFLRGGAYRASEAEGRLAFGEFATDPCRSLFKRVQTLFSPPAFSDNANVNVTRLGERYIAMTETPIPVQFDAQTLETAGVAPYTVPGHLSTAHPHMDRADGGMLNYAAKLGPRSSYRFFRVAPGGRDAAVIGSLGTDEPAYMHSFGLTERYLVLAEFPLVVNPLRLALSGRPYIENYRWRPERGTRFTLVDRVTGEARAKYRTDACFAFHHVNAFEVDGEVVVDVCAYDDATIVEDLYLERLRAGKPIAAAKLKRFRLGLGDSSIRSEVLADDVELPRINYGRCNERPYRYAWAVATGGTGWIDRISKVDLDSGGRIDFSEPGLYPGEPVFVARPEATDEDDGVLLSVVLDADAGRSLLLALDARDLSELARAEVPHHIPFSFHGQFDRR